MPKVTNFPRKHLLALFLILVFAALYAMTARIHPLAFSALGYASPFLVIAAIFRDNLKSKLFLLVYFPFLVILSLFAFEQAYQKITQISVDAGYLFHLAGPSINQTAVGGMFGIVAGLVFHLAITAVKLFDISNTVT